MAVDQPKSASADAAYYEFMRARDRERAARQALETAQADYLAALDEKKTTQKTWWRQELGG